MAVRFHVRNRAFRFSPWPEAEWQIWLGLVPFGIGVGLFNPTVSSMVSKTASANERGAVMGQYQAASAMGRFFGPAVSGPLFANVSIAAPFGLAALMMIPVLFLVGMFHLRVASDTATPESD